MSWSDHDLTVIADQRAYWTCWEASVLFSITPKQAKTIIMEAGIRPAGRRPHSGRGRVPLVYDADVLCDLLSML